VNPSDLSGPSGKSPASTPYAALEARVDDVARAQLPGVYSFVVDGVAFHADFARPGACFAAGPAATADVTVEVDDPALWDALVRGEHTVTGLVMRGQLRILGDLSRAMRLENFIFARR
jgi:hypothetical protein